jgi:hypothetical protein
MAKEKTQGRFKLPFKLPFFKNESKTTPPVNTLPCLKMVFFIVDWDKSGIISKVFEEEDVRFHFIHKGRGTASSGVLDLLGVGAMDRAVIVCVEQEILVPILFRECRKKLGFYSPGAGIAFTIPLSGINTPLLKVFKESINKNEKINAEREGETMASSEIGKLPGKQPGKAAGETPGEKPQEIKNDLVIGIINHGFSDEYMAVARDAGALGGTILHARGLVHEGPVKFFGVSVQEEKEIVLIVASRKKKLAIMEAVSRSYGITSKAEGLVFSLPVDSVMGVSLE